MAEDDSAYQELRRQRLAQLQHYLTMAKKTENILVMVKEESGQGRGSQQQEEQRRAIEEQNSQIIAQILTQDARERLNRVQLVKPETAKMVSDHLVMLATNGKLAAKIDEGQIIKLLEQVGSASKQSKITFQRKGEDDLVLGARKAQKKSDDSDSDNFSSSEEEQQSDDDD